MSDGQNKELKKTARHSAIYALGTMLRRISGLVMLPIYTRFLTPADYGVVELLTMSMNIMGIVIGLRMDVALFRYYILAEDAQEKRRVVSTVLCMVIATSGLGTLLVFLGSAPLSHMLFGNTDYVHEFNLFLVTLATNAISGVGMSYLRARRMPVVFVAVGAVMLLLEIALNVYFVVMLELHVTGVVYSAVISGAVLATALSLFVFTKAGIHFSRRLASELIGYAAPLIMAGLGASYVVFANRYFLRIIGGLEDVGLFALAARLASVLGTAFEAFNMSWVADRFEIAKQQNAREIYMQVFRFMSALLLLAASALAIFARDFFLIMTIPEFYPAANVVPILLVAALFRINGVFCSFGAIYRRRTRILAEAAWSKAIVATAGYYLLIPKLGVYGAALALLLGNMIEFAWLHRRSTSVYDMKLNWRPVLMMASVAFVMTLITLPLPTGELHYILLRLLAFAILVVLLIVMPVWRHDEREMLKSAVLSLVRPRRPR